MPVKLQIAVFQSSFIFQTRFPENLLIFILYIFLPIFMIFTSKSCMTFTVVSAFSPLTHPWVGVTVVHPLSPPQPCPPAHTYQQILDDICSCIRSQFAHTLQSYYTGWSSNSPPPHHTGSHSLPYLKLHVTYSMIKVGSHTPQSYYRGVE